MNGETNALLVLGMHRSGTSATSGALQHCGFALGGQLVPAAEDNPKGYFEHEAIVAQHERFLEALGRHWADPRPMPGDAWSDALADEVRESIRKVVAEDFRGRQQWAIKDPRLSRLLPLWAPLWRDLGARPHALLVIRRPAEVAGSLSRRDHFPEVLSDWLWIRHTLDALSAAADMPLACIDYAALLVSPANALRSALEHLGLAHGGLDGSGLTGFVDPGMNHHSIGQKARPLDVSRLADDLFDACAASPRGLSLADLASFEARVERCWSVDGPALEVGMRLAGRLIRERTVLRDNLYALNSAYAAQVRWSENAVSDQSRLRDVIERLEVEAAEAERVEGALRRDLELAEAVARARELERDHLMEMRKRLAVERDALALQFEKTLASRSWRWTAPFRAVAERFGRRPS